MPSLNQYLNDLRNHKASNQITPEDSLFCSYLVCLDEGNNLSNNEIAFIKRHVETISFDLLLVYDRQPLIIATLLKYRKIINSPQAFEYYIQSNPKYTFIEKLEGMSIDEIDILIKNISNFNGEDIIKMIDAGIFNNHITLAFDFLLRGCLYHGEDDFVKATRYFFVKFNSEKDLLPTIDENIFSIVCRHNAFYEFIQHIDNNLNFSDFIFKLSDQDIPFAVEIVNYLDLKKNMINF